LFVYLVQFSQAVVVSAVVPVVVVAALAVVLLLSDHQSPSLVNTSLTLFLTFQLKEGDI
jgi:hypothetical protein